MMQQESMNAGADGVACLLMRNKGNEKWQELNALFLNWCLQEQGRSDPSQRHTRGKRTRRRRKNGQVMLVAYLSFIV